MAVYSFSQGAIQTAYVQFKEYALTDELNVINLVWPNSYSDDEDVVANFMQISQTPDNPEIRAILILPDATQVSVGMNFFIYNTASSNISIQTNNLDIQTEIQTIQPDETYAFYLTDNSTTNGTYLTFQFGAGTSSASASLLAGEGLKNIGLTLNTNTKIITTNALNTVITPQNRADLFIWNGGGGNAFTFPSTGDVGNGFYFSINNQGQGSITLTTPGASIDGGNVNALDPQISSYFITDGVNWYTVGRGQPTFFSYNTTSISLAGLSGDLLLTENQANKTIITFTGILTADVTVVFPQIAYSWYISNSTTGPYKVYVVMNNSTLPSISIPQSQRMIFYSDNTNIYTTPTILLPEAGILFQNGSSENPSITFTGDQQSGAFLNGQNMGITQNGNFVCDFSYDAENDISIVTNPHDFGLAVGGNSENQFKFLLNSPQISTLTSPSIYGNIAPPNTQYPYFYIKPTNDPRSLGALRIATARLNSESFPNTSAVAISGVNSQTNVPSGLGIFSNLINISTNPGGSIIDGPAILLNSPTIQINASTALSITSLTTTVTGNATVTGNLTVTGNINNSTQPIEFPLPYVLGGTNANNRTTAFNNLSPLTTTGDLLGYLSPNNVRIANAGANGKSLISRTVNIPAWNGLSILQIQNLDFHYNSPGGVISGSPIPGFNISITPTYSNSKILFLVTIPGVNSNTGNTSVIKCFINDVNPYEGNTTQWVFVINPDTQNSGAWTYVYAPGNTTQQNLTFNIFNLFGTLLSNYSIENATIIAVEIGGN